MKAIMLGVTGCCVVLKHTDTASPAHNEQKPDVMTERIHITQRRLKFYSINQIININLNMNDITVDYYTGNNS